METQVRTSQAVTSAFSKFGEQAAHYASIVTKFGTDYYDPTPNPFNYGGVTGVDIMKDRKSLHRKAVEKRKKRKRGGKH